MNKAKYFIIILILIVICTSSCIAILKRNNNENDNNIDDNNNTISNVDVSTPDTNSKVNSSEIDDTSSKDDSSSKIDDTSSKDEPSSNVDEPSSKIDDTSSTENPSKQGYGYVYESSVVDASYFDDVLFIGDSVTNMLKVVNDSYKFLGDATFITSNGLGYGNSLWDLDYKYSVFPTYRGENMLVEDIVAEVSPSKVYIMFGMNDIGVFGIDQSVENMKELTSRILAKSPNVQIYIQSVTPIIRGMERDDLNNAYINEFNEKVCSACEELGFYFINVCEAVSDDEGYLIDEYCADSNYMGMHPSTDGCKAWANYLLKHTVN